ncbi:SDR family oxidoreductase [Hirschia maritima]|uniref:SDR family oxidoreductase n=1 Tax=Hirschia maritima TaxID=1121961 RepID=UPI000363C669|nr:SDR family oxidoreductase [Hirschia maritima]
MSKIERIFITGGSAGLGKALALNFARQGKKVCIADINDETGKSTLSELKALNPASEYLHCDVRSSEDFIKSIEWLESNWDGVDLVINNAGVAQMGPMETVSDEDWNWIVDINMMGIVRSTKAFLPVFQKQGTGRFLNIASMAGYLYMPDAAAYNATKAAVVAISETLMLEFEKYNVGVQVACPAFFRTDLAKNMRSSSEESEMMTKRMVERARIGADEIAEKIVKGIENNDSHIFTHPEAEQALQAKKQLAFKDFLNLMRMQLAQIEERMKR